jgi:hypothetical protein
MHEADYGAEHVKDAIRRIPGFGKGAAAAQRVA